MNKNEGNMTPGGTSTFKLANPHSSEAGSMESGGNRLLHFSEINFETANPFQQQPTIARTPVKGNNKSSSVTDIFSAGSYTNYGQSKLENENQKLKQKIEEMELLIFNLQRELITLKTDNKNSKTETKTISIELSDNGGILNRESSKKTVYSTDEEELERETNWILQKGKAKQNKRNKKRKAESSPVVEEPLEVQPAPHSAAKSKEKLPPPIFIVGVTNYSDIQSVMNNTTEQEFKITALNNNVWKINTSNSNAYRNLTMKLNTEKHQWYTYENKNDRPIKVMARGLHPTCEIKSIIEDLENKGFKILDAVNIMKRERRSEENSQEAIPKRGLPLFMLTFDKSEEVGKIYNITGILNMRVKIEAIKKASTRIVQCKKCQGFNHTQRYCAREPSCVKCAGKHPTQTCQLSKEEPAKCVNCRGQHPANYRGCEVAKQLQKIRDQKRKPQQSHPNPSQVRNVFSQHLRRENLTYAQATANSKENNTNDIKNFESAVQAILNSLEEQNKLNKLILDRLNLLELPSSNTARNK